MKELNATRKKKGAKNVEKIKHKLNQTAPAFWSIGMSSPDF